MMCFGVGFGMWAVAMAKMTAMKNRTRQLGILLGAEDAVRNAAPDLLEACKFFRSWMLGGQPGPFSDNAVLTIVDQAIEKAELEASVKG